jgi:hypothetical protein
VSRKAERQQTTLLATKFSLRTLAISLQGVLAPALSMLLPRSWQLSSDSRKLAPVAPQRGHDFRGGMDLRPARRPGSRPGETRLDRASLLAGGTTRPDESLPAGSRGPSGMDRATPEPATPPFCSAPPSGNSLVLTAVPLYNQSHQSASKKRWARPLPPDQPDSMSLPGKVKQQSLITVEDAPKLGRIVELQHVKAVPDVLLEGAFDHHRGGK